MGRLLKREWLAQLNGKAYYFKNRPRRNIQNQGPQVQRVRRALRAQQGRELEQSKWGPQRAVTVKK